MSLDGPTSPPSLSDRLFADAGRSRRLLLCGAAALLLGSYNAYIAMNVVFGYRDCLEDPARWDGARVVFPLWTVTGVEGPDRFRVSKVIHDVPVAGDATRLKVGDTISIRGHFRAADLVVVEEERELHPLRRWKERLGYLGVLVAGLAAPLLFRWRDGRIEARLPASGPSTRVTSGGP